MMQIKLSALVFVGLLLIGEGFSQCYLDIDCNGTTISATSKKDCCVGTNDGLAYFENGDCSVCIVHGFQRAKYNITEDNEDAVIVVFERNVKSSTNMPLPLRGTITVTAGGTADVADFQQVPNVTLVDDKAEISIETRNDRIALEYDDQIILTYTSSRSGFIAVVERDGEFIRDRAIFCIIDNDRLEINFKESDIPITEGLALPQIVVNFRQVQNSFTLIVMPETIASAEDQIVNLNDFIGSDSINDDFRATIGKRCPHVRSNMTMDIFSQMILLVDPKYLQSVRVP
jgi:hypothetical protein